MALQWKPPDCRSSGARPFVEWETQEITSLPKNNSGIYGNSRRSFFNPGLHYVYGNFTHRNPKYAG